MDTEKLRQQLMDRLIENYADYRAGLLLKDRQELIDGAEKIADTAATFQHLTDRQYTEQELSYLLKFQNPLEVVTDHWGDYELLPDTPEMVVSDVLDNIGHELRSVGGHLKNAGRAMTGKEALTVDGGQEGRFQSVVLAPMRATQKLLTGMNNATLATIGGVEHLEQTAEDVREARAERQAEKKPSIRQTLAEKKAEAAARSAPAPEKEHKPQEAAL